MSLLADMLDPMLHWLEEELETARFDRKFATDREAALPTRPPSVHGRHLTGLWLLPDFGVLDRVLDAAS